jgi:hypothetical protein
LFEFHNLIVILFYMVCSFRHISEKRLGLMPFVMDSKMSQRKE